MAAPDTGSGQLACSVYTPESRLRRPVRLLRGMLLDLVAARGLAWHLTVRDINARYRQTALGFLWAFILPVANTLIWVFLNSSGVVVMQDTLLPYPVYVFTGTMLWAIFSDAVNAPLQQVTAAKTMLVKINFSREALILSGIYQTLFNGAIRVAVLIAALLVMGVQPGSDLLLVPLAMLSLIVAGTGIGLLVTPVGMLYTDVGKSIPLLMQFLMYLSPVVFPVPEQGLAARVFELNPVTPLIMTARDWLTGMPAEYAQQFMSTSVLALVLLFMVGILFRLTVPILIERMGS